MKKFINLFLVIIFAFSFCLIGCGKTKDDTTTHVHEIVAVKGVEPTGVENGFKNHYKCESCQKLFLDNKGKNETTLDKITIPKHNLIKVDKVEASNISVGNIEYYKCNDNGCSKLFKDNQGKNEILIEDTTLVKFISTNIEYVYNDIPDVISSAEEVEFYDFFVDGESDAMTNKYQMLDGGLPEQYVYLKRLNQGDFVAEFNITYEGIYEFGVEIFAIVLNEPERRVTNIQIDNSDYIMLDYFHPQNHNGLRQFATGFSAYLSEGKHKFILNLPDVFDDETVKSLYIHSFYFTQGE